jgi:hypothetical protein
MGTDVSEATEGRERREEVDLAGSLAQVKLPGRAEIHPAVPTITSSGLPIQIQIAGERRRTHQQDRLLLSLYDMRRHRALILVQREVGDPPRHRIWESGE